MESSPEINRKTDLQKSPSSENLSKRRMSAFRERFIGRIRDGSKSDQDRVRKGLLKDIKSRSLKSLISQLQDEIDLQDVDPKGTLLKYAVEHNYEEAVDILVNHDSPMVSHGDDGLSPTQLSIKLNYMRIFHILVENDSDLNAETLYEKRTAVHMAVRCNSAAALDTLIQYGADVNKTDIYSSSPLHLAARLGRDDLIKILLANGAQVDLIDNEGWTALHAASVAGNLGVVRLLLQSHCAVDSQSKYGKTSLHWACEKGHLSVIQVLLDHNASTTIKDLSNKAPIDYAKTPLLINLLKSYTRVPTSKNLDQAHEFMDYNTKTMSLIDLIDVSQYQDPYAHRINTDLIGRGAMRDAQSKMDKSKSKSMVYLLEEKENTVSFEEDFRQRSKTMGPALELDSIANSASKHKANMRNISHRPKSRYEPYDDIQFELGSIPEGQTLDSFPSVQIHQSRPSVGSPNEQRRSLDKTYSSDYSEDETYDSLPETDRINSIGSERFQSMDISDGECLSEPEKMKSIDSGVYTSLPDHVFHQDDKLLTSQTILSQNQSTRPLDSIDNHKSISKTHNQTFSRGHSSGSECSSSDEFSQHNRGHSTKGQGQDKVAVTKLVGSLEKLHGTVDDSIDESVDILNRVFTDLFTLRANVSDGSTRENDLNSIEADLKIMLIKLAQLKNNANNIVHGI